MNRIKLCQAYINYTWQHKKAFLAVEKQTRGFNTWRGYLHDTDKLFRYLSLLWNPDTKRIQRSHRRFSGHHVENKKIKSQEDLIEMAIDWECASLTKADKPLLAFATMIKHYPDMEAYVMPAIAALGMLTPQAIEQAIGLNIYPPEQVWDIVRHYRRYEKTA